MERQRLLRSRTEAAHRRRLQNLGSSIGAAQKGDEAPAMACAVVRSGAREGSMRAARAQQLGWNGRLVWRPASECHLHGLAPLTARLAALSVAADIPQVRLIAGMEVPLHRLEIQLQPRLNDLADGRLARACTTQQQSAYAWLCHFAVLGSP